MYSPAVFVTALLGTLMVSSVKIEAKTISPVSSSIEEFPFMVSLDIEFEAGKGTFPLCAGVILHPEYILAKAGCVKNMPEDPDLYRVRAGSKTPDNQSGSVYLVAEFSIHPDYTEEDTSHDNLLIARLAEPIKIDNVTTKAIPMLEPSEKIKAGEPALAPSWGPPDSRSRRLRSVQLTIVDNAECREIYGDVGDSSEDEAEVEGHEVFNEVREGKVCARELCTGDMLGPLVVRGKLAGYIGHVETCDGAPEYPAVFAHISQYRDWINERIQSEG